MVRIDFNGRFLVIDDNARILRRLLHETDGQSSATQCHDMPRTLDGDGQPDGRGQAGARRPSAS
jgi:hypothetical protein